MFSDNDVLSASSTVSSATLRLLSGAEVKPSIIGAGSGGTCSGVCGISIYRGIVTGLNEALVLDNETKEKLVRQDPRSAEILKPLVRGRDVRTWRVDWKRRWLITTFPAAHVDIDRYPAIRRWLQSFGPRLHQSGETVAPGLKARKKTPHAWYELQDSCAYHADFAKPKIIWIELASEGRFAFNEAEMYCNNTAFILVGPHLHWLCTVLNSFVAQKWIGWTARTSGMGTTRWEKGFVEGIPVPFPTAGQAATAEKFVRRARQQSGRGGPSDRASGWQVQAAQLVATAYGLGDDESESPGQTTPDQLPRQQRVPSAGGPRG